MDCPFRNCFRPVSALGFRRPGTIIGRMNPYKMGAMRDRTYRQHGQSFTELAIFMPILILLLAGMVEVVFLFNDYLQMLDAARNGSREASDSDPFPAETGSFGVTTAPGGAYDAIKDCGSSQNFFRNTACNTNAGRDATPAGAATCSGGFRVLASCAGGGEGACRSSS